MKSTTPAEIPDFLRDPSAREERFTLISVDDHLVEPPQMFVNREPVRFAGRFPRVVDLEPGQTYSREHQGLPPLTIRRPGRQAWVFEDQMYLQVGLNAVVGHQDFGALASEPSSFHEMRPGCYDVHARVKDMDIGGIWASVNFPSSITGFAGTVYARSHDAELGLAVTQAWNDWMFEEWHGAYPERLVPLGITWLADPVLGASEIRRNAARGFTAVSFPETPHRLGYPPAHDRFWDPILQACEETDTALCLHVGSSGMFDMPASGPRFEKNVTLFPALSLVAAVDWVWSGVPVRYPELKIVLSEGGIGWVPMLLDRLEFVQTHAGSVANYREWTGGQPPAQLLIEHFYFCMLDDPSALASIDRMGADRVMAEVDYPHSDCTWPDTQDLLHGRFAAGGLPSEQIDQITHLNAARVFRHPLPGPDRLRSARS